MLGQGGAGDRSQDPASGASTDVYGRSVTVIAGATLLAIIGLVVTVGAVVLVALDLLAPPQAGDIGAAARRSLYSIASTALVLGLFHILVGLYVIAHRTWARILAFILAILGLLGAAAFTVGSPGPDIPTAGAITGIVLILAYGIVALGMATGGAHFRKVAP